MVVESKDLYLLEHYGYGEAFYGSVGGMRYRVNRNPMVPDRAASKEEMQDVTLIVYIWPGPKNFAKTPKEEMISKEFAYSDEGKEEAAAWISAQYEERKAFWEETAAKGILG
ncbi:MAG: hypothetical protein J1E61_08835 [Lachnospiraceae bacterium]|nr:hypothetical protein [Lachnospiraceae bacterium]